jgi:hypothetical protein
MPAKDTSRHPYTSQASQLHPNHSNATNSLVTAGEIQETKPAFRRAKRTFDRRQRMQTWCSTGLMAVLTIVATVFAILQYANGAPDENVIWGQNWEIDKWCKHVVSVMLSIDLVVSFLIKGQCIAGIRKPQSPCPYLNSQRDLPSFRH